MIFNKYNNIILLLLVSSVTNAITVLPEIRTTVSVSKTDINRIGCTNGVITSIDYAAGTGLTHKTHNNGKNVIVIFQQLDNGVTRELINSKVNLLVGCNNEYYPLILDPQEIDSQTIHLQTTELEVSAEDNKALLNQSREQVLIDLIKRGRAKNADAIQKPSDPSQNIFIKHFQLQLLEEMDVYGTHFQIRKFVVMHNGDAQQVTLQEKQFISDQLSTYPIAALSLDDYELDQKKDWTLLYVVVNKGTQHD